MRENRKRINDRTWYARHKDQAKATRRAYYAANREKAIACVRNWQKNNPQRANSNWKKSRNKPENQIRRQAVTFFWLLGVIPTESMIQLKITHIKAQRCLQKKKPTE